MDEFRNATYKYNKILPKFNTITSSNEYQHFGCYYSKMNTTNKNKIVNIKSSTIKSYKIMNNLNKLEINTSPSNNMDFQTSIDKYHNRKFGDLLKSILKDFHISENDSYDFKLNYEKLINDDKNFIYNGSCNNLEVFK